MTPATLGTCSIKGSSTLFPPPPICPCTQRRELFSALANTRLKYAASLCLPVLTAYFIQGEIEDYSAQAETIASGIPLEDIKFYKFIKKNKKWSWRKLYTALHDKGQWSSVDMERDLRGAMSRWVQKAGFLSYEGTTISLIRVWPDWIITIEASSPAKANTIFKKLFKGLKLLSPPIEFRTTKRK